MVSRAMLKRICRKDDTRCASLEIGSAAPVAADALAADAGEGGFAEADGAEAGVLTEEDPGSAELPVPVSLSCSVWFCGSFIFIHIHLHTHSSVHPAPLRRPSIQRAAEPLYLRES